MPVPKPAKRLYSLVASAFTRHQGTARALQQCIRELERL